MASTRSRRRLTALAATTAVALASPPAMAQAGEEPTDQVDSIRTTAGVGMAESQTARHAFRQQALAVAASAYGLPVSTFERRLATGDLAPLGEDERRALRESILTLRQQLGLQVRAIDGTSVDWARVRQQLEAHIDNKRAATV